MVIGMAYVLLGDFRCLPVANWGCTVHSFLRRWHLDQINRCSRSCNSILGSKIPLAFCMIGFRWDAFCLGDGTGPTCARPALADSTRDARICSQRIHRPSGAEKDC